MTLVVASLVERSISGVSDSSKAAFSAGADIVELRLDHLESIRDTVIAEARSVIRGPTIATLRSRAQGGRSTLEGAARERKLRHVIDSDFEYVDLELATDARLLKTVAEEEIRPVTIASSHFPGPVSRVQIEKAIAKACTVADIGKVAMPCEHAGQAVMLAQTALSLASTKKRYVIIGMGTQGQVTRICADRLRSELVYSCIPGKEAAPGQLDVISQRKLMDDRKILLGLLGHPVSHSVSKPMQEAALADAGISGAYVPLDFPPEELDARVLSVLRDLGFAGLNVTIPHKFWAFKTCTRKGPPAVATRAVNTIKFTRENFVGENTDVIGFSKLLYGKIAISENTNSLLVGAGGAARAVAYVLRKKGARISVTDIDLDRARKLARDFKGRAMTIKDIWLEKQEFQLVVNCTPVGMKGASDDSPVRDYVFRPGAVFVDIIFNPPRTTAMKIAEAKGVKAYGGLEMLVQQGVESFRLWTGVKPNVDAMREAARRALA
jgi:shikimate dehydrogenase/3-dehydroquinate dehydratase type I